MIDNLVLGAMLFGTVQDEHRSFELLDRFVDAGGVWIDTANCYSFWEDPTGFGGQSEALLGRWLANRPGVRDRVKISTKVGCEPTVAGRFPETAEDLSARVIKNGIEGSLRRLAHKSLPTTRGPCPSRETLPPGPVERREARKATGFPCHPAVRLPTGTPTPPLSPSAEHGSRRFSLTPLRVDWPPPVWDF